MDKKAVTLKFNPKEIKTDYTKSKAKLDQILYENKNILLHSEIYDDYEKTVGYHFNGIISSSSYKTLLEKYKLKGPKKDKEVFLFMKPLPKIEEPIWRNYCLKRQTEFNIHHATF